MRYNEFLNEAANKAAVVGWGRGMGHKGHMLLAKAVIEQAKQMNATPLFYVSEKVGKDDPLTPPEKLQIYKKVFPEYAKIFHSGTDISSILTKLSSKFKNVVLIVGADQESEFGWLMDKNKVGVVNYKSYGIDNLHIMKRQDVNDPAQKIEGPRATPMREILMDPNSDENARFALWRDSMPNALSDEEVMSLMKRAEQRLNAPKPPRKKPVKKTVNKLKESAAKLLADKLPQLKKHDYSTIDKLMQRISKRYDITGKNLHDLFVSKYGHTPDTWIKKYKETLGEKTVTESVESDQDIQKIKDFIQWSIKTLNIQQPFPKITLSRNTQEAQQGHHTGRHTNDGRIWVYIENRNLIDIFRTIFHELVHHRQYQLNMIGPDDSYPGSPIEAMADMLAGKYIKIYGKQHRDIFQ